MTIATIFSRAQFGMDAPLVRVEVDIGNGLPAFNIVGLPEAVVKESKDRVRAALVNCQFELPAGRITVNLAPADFPKEGGRFDLPIAIGILVASGQLAIQQIDLLAQCEFYGELSLSGEVRSIKGALVAALRARDAGHAVILPTGNQTEVAVIDGCEAYAANHLLQVCAHLTAAEPLSRITANALPQSACVALPDLQEVRGQAHAKRALEIAAAGAHSLLLVGPPGTGKSMLAQRLPALLPPMTDEEAVQSAAVRSLTGMSVDLATWRSRPFRAPHHTASGVALVGGGSTPRPGEISLAHHGVLFLDELPEFDRKVLEVLREPLETGHICISRAARQAEFPAQFQMIAAMNPCPCGYLGDVTGQCRCSAEQVQRYRQRISGPLLDRLDMHVEVPRIPAQVWQARDQQEESSAQVAERVMQARQRQLDRQGVSNARLSAAQTQQHCVADAAAQALLIRATQKLALSARAYHRVLRLARTIADLASAATIGQAHIAEAIALRKLDRAHTQQ